MSAISERTYVPLLHAIAMRTRGDERSPDEVEQLEPIDPDAARRALDLLALACARALVDAHAALLDRRVHRRQLIVLAAPRGEHRLDRLARDVIGARASR